MAKQPLRKVVEYWYYRHQIVVVKLLLAFVSWWHHLLCYDVDMREDV